jgi:hypothetical protein
MNHIITSNGNELILDDHVIRLDYPIRQTVLMDNRIIVVFDYMAKQNIGQFRNLRAYDFEGKELWIAQHPSNETVDTYVEITNNNPLIVWNYAGYICEIDPTNGKIIKATFAK